MIRLPTFKNQEDKIIKLISSSKDNTNDDLSLSSSEDKDME